MKGGRSVPPVQVGGTKDVEEKLQVERETNRQLQQLLIQTETELLDLKMELKMTRVNQFDESSGTTDPSAPPPPYGHGHHDNQSHSPSVNSSGSSASSSDNNLPTMDDTDYIDVDRVVNGRRPGWTVRADVHERVSEEEKRTEFTFTESALDLITSNTTTNNATIPIKNNTTTNNATIPIKNTSPMKRMNN